MEGGRCDSEDIQLFGLTTCQEIHGGSYCDTPRESYALSLPDFRTVIVYLSELRPEKRELATLATPALIYLWGGRGVPLFLV